eukprot:CAMPEP_0114313176 /NCGR_PEP_ID=MMETSP0059-20121206/20937_1 /TAXON_ID=36894 /ORGANISM="Pyramimonas parkeae, Strain CCMP726" /LENGTH=84 /DNA_ID=CAMNT_0001437837 /DNA_START=41 /DNA_END=292 /DNA_ORIENTATION=+
MGEPRIVLILNGIGIRKDMERLTPKYCFAFLESEYCMQVYVCKQTEVVLRLMQQNLVNRLNIAQGSSTCALKGFEPAIDGNEIG